MHTAKRKPCFRSPAGVSSDSVISSFCKRPALRRKLNTEEVFLLSGRLALLHTQSREDSHSFKNALCCMQNEHSLSTCLLEAQFVNGNYQITAFFEMLISIPSLNSSVHITLAALVLRWHSVHFCHRHRMPGWSSLEEDIFSSQFQGLGVHHVDDGMVARMAPSMAVEDCTLTWSHLDKSEIRELRQHQKWVKHSRATPRKTSALISVTGYHKPSK